MCLNKNILPDWLDLFGNYECCTMKPDETNEDVRDSLPNVAQYKSTLTESHISINRYRDVVHLC